MIDICLVSKCLLLRLRVHCTFAHIIKDFNLLVKVSEFKLVDLCKCTHNNIQVVIIISTLLYVYVFTDFTYLINHSTHI